MDAGDGGSSSSVPGSATEAREGSGGPPPAGAEKARKGRRREVMLAYWREVKAGRRKRVERPYVDRDPGRNPLFTLSEELRSKLFVFLRECPYHDAARAMLERQGAAGATDAQLDQFFVTEGQNQWEVRTRRAVEEAGALVALAEGTVPKLSEAMVAALGQEAFRQVVNGGVDPEAMGRLTKLFMSMRSSNRVEQMQELRQEKLRHELQGQAEQALEQLTDEVERRPEAQEAFEALQRELTERKEDAS